MKRRPRELAFAAVAAALGWYLLESAAGASLAALRAHRAAESGQSAPPDWLVAAEEAFDSGFYLPDPDVLWRPRPGYVEAGSQVALWGGEPLRINALGLRGPETGRAPAPGTRRILVLGGSHPFGMWVRAEDAYAGVLGAALAGRGWEVLNAACPGHTTWQGLRYLERYGLALQPDVVVFDLGTNDGLPLAVDWAAPDRRVAAVPPWAAAGRRLAGRSHVYRALRLALAPLATPAPGAVRVSADDRREVLAGLRALAERTGLRVLAASQVAILDAPAQGRPAGAARCVWDAREWTPRVDVCGLFEPMGPDARRYFVDAMHANAEGHRMIAAAVLAELDALGWLEPEAAARPSDGPG